MSLVCQRLMIITHGLSRPHDHSHLGASEAKELARMADVPPVLVCFRVDGDVRCGAMCVPSDQSPPGFSASALAISTRVWDEGRYASP